MYASATVVPNPGSARTQVSGHFRYRVIETMQWMQFIAVFCGKRPKPAAAANWPVPRG